MSLTIPSDNYLLVIFFFFKKSPKLGIMSVVTDLANLICYYHMTTVT